MSLTKKDTNYMPLPVSTGKRGPKKPERCAQEATKMVHDLIEAFSAVAGVSTKDHTSFIKAQLLTLRNNMITLLTEKEKKATTPKQLDKALSSIKSALEGAGQTVELSAIPTESATNSYAVFLAEHRNELDKDKPKGTTLAAHSRAIWSKLPAEEKEGYKEKAKQNKTEVKEWQARTTSKLKSLVPAISEVEDEKVIEKVENAIERITIKSPPRSPKNEKKKRYNIGGLLYTVASQDRGDANTFVFMNTLGKQGKESEAYAEWLGQQVTYINSLATAEEQLTHLSEITSDLETIYNSF